MRTFQDRGNRYDQLLGGDGNLISSSTDSRSISSRCGSSASALGPFAHASVTYSLNSQREERVNQGGNGNPTATIGHEPERTTVHGFMAPSRRQLSARQSLTLGGDVYFEKLTSDAFNVNPVNGRRVGAAPARARRRDVPQGGVFAQTAFDVDTGSRAPDRRRCGSAAPATRRKASDSPLVSGAAALARRLADGRRRRRSAARRGHAGRSLDDSRHRSAADSARRT